MLFKFLLVVLLSAGCVSSLTDEQMAQKTKMSSCIVSVDGYYGSGVIIPYGDKTYVITARHCLDRSSELLKAKEEGGKITVRQTIKNPSIIKMENSVEGITYGIRYEGTVVGMSKSNEPCDIAVIRIDKKLNAPKVIICNDKTPLVVGSKVFSTGAFFGDMYANTFAKGNITNSRKYMVNAKNFLVQTNIPIMPGYSGSGVFDENGHLVGMFISKYDTISFFQSYQDIYKWLCQNNFNFLFDNSEYVQHNRIIVYEYSISTKELYSKLGVCHD